MTATMKAGVATAEGLAVREVPRPVPGPEQVLVRVAAAGLNRADLGAAKGTGVATADAFGKPIGMEWAGEVVDCGSAVTGFRPGDRVMCNGTGGYAEYAVSDFGRTIGIDRMDFATAAVLPLALMTAHDAVVTHGRLAAGEAILIQGASSGVGLMALQIARWRGASVAIGTSSEPGRRSRLAVFGATHALDARDPGFLQQVAAATGGKGVDAVVDMVSGPAFADLMKAAAVRARIVNVGRLGGMSAEFDFDLHAAKRLDYIGVTFRTRSLGEIREIVSRMQADLSQEIASGRIGLPIDRSYPLDEAPAAHEHMRSNGHFGKIVLVP